MSINSHKSTIVLNQKRFFSSLFLAFFLIGSTFFPAQKEIIEDADLYLDMMEYKAAIENYSKALTSHPHQRDIRKNIGYAHFQLENFNDAIKFLEEEIKLFPDNQDAYDLLISILFELNRLNEAMDHLENPHIGGLSSFNFGMHFKEKKEYDLAKRYFTKAIEKGHDPVECHIQLMDMDLIQEGGLSPKEASDRAIDLYGSQPEFFTWIGLAYFEKSKKEYNNISKAIRYFEKALELHPFFKDALFNLACIKYNEGSFKEASEYFKRILIIELENPEIELYFDCSQERTDKKKAFPECPQKINLSREFVDEPEREYTYRFKNEINFVIENINYLGLEFIKRGKFHEALRRYRNGLKIHPESPEINFNMGMVLFWLNYLTDAEKYTLRALRQKGYFGRLSTYRKQEILKKEGAQRIDIRRIFGIDTYGRDEIFRKKGGYLLHEIPLSEWTFDMALKEGNYFLDAYDLLGNIYFKKEDFAKSISAYKKVIEIDPEDSIGHYNLGCAYSALKDRKNAEMEWTKAIEYEKELRKREKRGEVSDDELRFSLIVVKRPVSFKAHKSLGRLYIEQNLVDKALEEFLKAVDLEPNDPDSYLELGKIYHQKSEIDKKNIGKAVFYYKKYLYLGGKEEAKVKESLKELRKKNFNVL